MKEEALKLADDLEKGLYNLNNIDFEKASAMIRRLVEELDKAQYRKSNQKPYGYLCDWGNTNYGITRQVFYYTQQGSATEDDWNEIPKVHKNLPLYTHPHKELTNEEIDEVSKTIWERPWLEKHREFARAIEERHGIK